ncbi:Gfo/Idh/MocA family protein [Algoriphagus namhaensis]
MGKVLGLIGCGIWGRNILRDLIQLGQNVAVIDPSEANRQEALGLGAQATWAEKPADFTPSGWIISTPAITHFEVIQQVLPDGVPIFIEKPLTCDRSQAEALLDTGREDIFVMHNWRYHPGILMLADLVKSKELGDLKFYKSNRCNWTSPRSDVDSVWTLIPHDITIARAMLGYFPKPKAAVVEKYEGVERGMTALMGDDIPCVLEVSNRYADKRREVRLHFSEGVAVLKDEKVDYLEIYRGNDRSKPEELILEKREFSKVSPLLSELSAFIKFLEGGDQPISDLEEGVRVIQIIDELKKLANT